MLTQPFHKKTVTFITRWGLHPYTRSTVRLLGPCFKTGAKVGSGDRGPKNIYFKPQPLIPTIAFPTNNFTRYFTLFSKCFSSFHHCTCSLSVSQQYLALDGVYHPLELHSQTTRLALKQYIRHRQRDYNPLWCSFPEDLHPSLTTSITTRRSDFKLSFCRFTRRY